MSKPLAIVRLVLSVLIMGLVVSPLAVWAEPALQADCAGNVLLNPGFEDGFTERGSGQVNVANGWNIWYQDGPKQADGFNRRPEFKSEDARIHTSRRIHSGTFAQKVFTTYATHNGGVLQQVSVTPGSKLTFSAWVEIWSSQGADPDSVSSPGNYRVFVGIDPTGGTDGQSPNVVWSESRMEYNTHMRLQTQTEARSGTVTVFLRGQAEFRVTNNDSYWDDACLTVVRPTPRATNTPRNTAVPTATPLPSATATSTATAMPTATPVPLAGGICVSTFVDPNGNGRRDDGEALSAGSIIVLLDGNRNELDRYTTDGLSEPFCFSGLEAGTYYLQRKNPTGYVSTVPDDWAVVVLPGAQTKVELSSRFVPTASPTPTMTRTAAPTATPTPRPVVQEAGRALYSISGILLAALALIVPAGLHYLRRIL